VLRIACTDSSYC